MPNYARVSILGSTVGGEVWSINPVFDPTGEFGGIDQADMDAATAAIDAITIPSSLLATISVSMSVTGCRLEVRDSGNDELQAISVHTKTTATPGTSAVGLPPQSAIVFSLRTNTPGGRGRGRVYWPSTSVTLTSAFRLNAPAPATLLNDFKTYMNAIDTALTGAFDGLPFDLAVRSRTAAATPHVTRIQLGNVIDTQRRRRDSLPESYVSVNMP